MDSFDTTDKRISLVHEIQRATRSTGYAREGWGFRLAANWLKDIGLHDFCKPDTHVAKFVKALGLTNHKTDEAVFRAFVDMIEQVKQTDPKASAFTADRLVYLIGSGDFYASNVWYRGSMEDFIAKVKIELYLDKNSYKKTKFERPSRNFDECGLVEYYPIQLQTNDDAEQWAAYTNYLREVMPEVNRSVRLPAPLHFASKIEEYLLLVKHR